jgi:hypothetical protein
MGFSVPLSNLFASMMTEMRLERRVKHRIFLVYFSDAFKIVSVHGVINGRLKAVVNTSRAVSLLNVILKSLFGLFKNNERCETHFSHFVKDSVLYIEKDSESFIFLTSGRK